MTYDERQKQKITLEPELAQDLWSAMKYGRDAWANARHQAEHYEKLYSDLLQKMKSAGMSEHLPTVEEMQAMWRGEKS